ncbi:MAG: methyltransferase [Jatrophihabitantaceae bacterium]
MPTAKATDLAGQRTPDAGTEPAPSPEPIVRVATGFMAAKQLFASSELGLFAALADGPLPLPALAARAGVPPRPCRILADAMVGLGVLDRVDDAYRNGPAAAAYLAGASGGLDLRPYLAFWDGVSYPHWLHFADSMRTDTPQQLDISGERQGLFFGGVQAYNSAHALMLAEHVDFSGCRRVLDLGGLSGAFLAAILAKDPAVRGTFLAPAQMVEFARAGLAPAELTRIELLAADPLTDPLPAGPFDVVLLEHVIHRFDAADNQRLLARARELVEPGGRLMILDFCLDESVPLRALDSLLAGEYLVIDGTVVYPEAEVRSWLAATGWQWERTVPLPGSPRVLVARA